MLVRKANGKIYGAELTAAEKKAMDLEIQRQIAEYDKKHLMEINAVVLWELHNQLGFGVERLKKFYDNFGVSMESLMKRYELDDSDSIWLYTKKLKDYGVDLESWSKEGK